MEYTEFDRKCTNLRATGLPSGCSMNIEQQSSGSWWVIEVLVSRVGKFTASSFNLAQAKKHAEKMLVSMLALRPSTEEEQE